MRTARALRVSIVASVATLLVLGVARLTAAVHDFPGVAPAAGGGVIAAGFVVAAAIAFYGYECAARISRAN